MAGSELRGAVLVDTSCNAGEKITLQLHGFSDSTSWHRTVKNTRRYLRKSYAENKFLEITLPIIEFTASNTPKARSAYPFSILLPEDLG